MIHYSAVQLFYTDEGNTCHYEECRLLGYGAHAGFSRADFSTLKMEAIRPSETSVHTRSIRRHIPEEGILHSHRRENLKSYKCHYVPIASSLSGEREEGTQISKT
jgi:hypothetical protein